MKRSILICSQVNLLVETNKSLAILDTLSSSIPNMDLFIAMHVRKEALLSSQIEGSQATLEDILDPLIEENTNQDVADVINYIKASEYAFKRLETLPLCNRLLKETHAVLFQGVRGQEKSPGKFRTSQNWIGAARCNLKTARYIPPCPVDTEKAMSDLEIYINSDDSLDTLIQTALIHYQFETIHPFLDGNGRIGRLLIILFLIKKGVLHTPSLYISYFLKKNRIEYYDRMSAVRITGNYQQWIKFFLQAIQESAQDAISKIQKLTALHNSNLIIINGLGRATKSAKKLFSYLESSPIIDIKKTANDLGLAFSTISLTIEKFLKAGILVQNNNANRNRVFSYKEYLDILRNE